MMVPLMYSARNQLKDECMTMNAKGFPMCLNIYYECVLITSSSLVTL